MSSIPALVKKRESIAEYIIYRYQTEDLVISYALNLDDILEYVIQHMSQNKELIKEQLLWYANIIEQMNNEDIVNTKLRLKSTQKYVDRLTSLHEIHLMNDLSYISLYKKAKSDIEGHISLSENAIENPVQICLNGLYGMLLLKLNGKKVTTEQQQTLTNFGALLEHLSEAYKEKYPTSK